MNFRRMYSNRKLFETRFVDYDKKSRNVDEENRLLKADDLTSQPNNDSKEQTNQLVTLTYNGQQAIKVDRIKLANSCPYFRSLLNGSFKEKNESLIDIKLGDLFSFKVFEAAIRFAETGHLERHSPVEFYKDLIKLAQLWLLDNLIEVIETNLIEVICFQDEDEIHTLANLYEMKRLKEKCEEFETAVEALGRGFRDWPNCGLDDHENHHYLNCPGSQRTASGEEENWDLLES